ncbi:MAG: AraC family transcriptional regulator [Alphaproteobacteria bacterium]|nr:AraC family transcriptional regulator [Alphaproteobacteria bacterium]
MKSGHTSTVRAAALTGFDALCRSHELDPAALLREAGLPPDPRLDPDRRLPVAAVNRVLERAADAAGVEDFGLRLAELRGFSNLGPVTLLARDEPDMRSALRVFMAYLPLHNEALDVSLAVEGDVAILRCRIMAAGPAVQATDLAVAMLHRILRQLIGGDWSPEAVLLERAAPARPAQFQRIFGRRVAFGQDISGIAFAPGELARPNLLADAGLRRYIAPLRDALGSGADEALAPRVRRLLHAMIAHRRATAPLVARQLGLSRRTLDRRLAEEGRSFQTLLDEVRGEIAQGQLAGSRRRAAEIAAMTGFGSSAAFSAWFSARFGMPPGRWRRQGRAAV